MSLMPRPSRDPKSSQARTLFQLGDSVKSEYTYDVLKFPRSGFLDTMQSNFRCFNLDSVLH